MKRLIPICMLFCLLLTACATRHTSYLEVFEGPFSAELEGKVGDIPFSALLEMEQATDPAAARVATLTFYAPETLAGTVLRRTAEGSFELSFGDLTVTHPSDGGIAELLGAFERVDGVRDTALTEEGRTRVSGTDFTWEFLSDGTPIALTTSNVSVTVVRFATK